MKCNNSYLLLCTASEPLMQILYGVHFHLQSTQSSPDKTNITRKVNITFIILPVILTFNIVSRVLVESI